MPSNVFYSDRAPQLIPGIDQVGLGAVGVVKLIAGGAMLFHELIGAVEWLAFDQFAACWASWWCWYVVPLPMIGGLIVFFIAQRFLKGDHGHGVSGMLTAVTLHGRTHPNVRHRFTTVIKTQLRPSPSARAALPGP